MIKITFLSYISLIGRSPQRMPEPYAISRQLPHSPQRTESHPPAADQILFPYLCTNEQ